MANEHGRHEAANYGFPYSNIKCKANKLRISAIQKTTTARIVGGELNLQPGAPQADRLS